MALSGYRARGMNGGLSVQEGVSVQIVEKSPNGWWLCKIGNEEGWIPSSHLERQEKKAKPVDLKPAVARNKRPIAKPSPVASGVEYVAISDYSDNEKLNITLTEGAIVRVVEKNESGWWYVESRGAEGWAPSTFLKEKPKERPKPPPKANVSRPGERPQGSRPPPARPSPPSRPKNVPAGQRKDQRLAAPPVPNRVNKPSLKDSLDRSRVPGRHSGSVENLLQKFQLKPTVPLKQARSADDLLPGGHEVARGREGQRGAAQPFNAQFYVAAADFMDGDKDTLDLKVGDRVEVLQRDEGGWWLAKLGSQTGWVPSNYLEKT